MAEWVVAASASPDAPFEIVRRSPTLGGSVPLRAARACPPLLAANALGWVLRPRRPITIQRGLRRIDSSLPVLRARAVSGRAVELVVSTGLTVRSAPPVCCVVETPRNRRDRRVEVVRTVAPPDAEITLELVVALGRGEAATLDGELACVVPYVDPPSIELLTPESGSALVEAHVRFFDADYFAAKRRGPSAKYKRAQRANGKPTATSSAGVSLVHLGGAPPRVERDETGRLVVTLASEVDARLSFHGQAVELDLDAATLKRRSGGIEAAMRAALGESPPLGALRYFTTYATAHAPGDPHAFFKPATLVATEPGWALVVDGPAGPGLESMRGVTDPSWFHALPAVTEVLGSSGRLGRGARLVTARFTRTELLDAELAWER